ncbi:MAG TPA: hypothetical protein VGB45_09180 [Abditibacterium sp.]|jgi:hypothetical protein
MQNPQNPYNSPPIAAPTGESPFVQQLPPGANNSGMGAQSVLPDELKGLNGGAFFLTLFWAISHSVWIGLICLVPYVGWIISFVLLFKGNEMAWQNRKWESVAQFKEVQRKWLIWGIILFVVSLILGVAAAIFSAAMVASNPGAFAPSR